MSVGVPITPYLSRSRVEGMLTFICVIRHRALCVVGLCHWKHNTAVESLLPDALSRIASSMHLQDQMGAASHFEGAA